MINRTWENYKDKRKRANNPPSVYKKGDSVYYLLPKLKTKHEAIVLGGRSSQSVRIRHWYTDKLGIVVHNCIYVCDRQLEPR